LPERTQKAAADPANQRGVLPEGLYRLRVREIDTSQQTGGGDGKWIFQFDVIDGPRSSGRLFEHCGLSDAAAWKISQIFDALGFTLDSESDELIGATCLATVVQEVIEQGKRQGQMGNNVSQYLEDDERELSAGAAMASAGAGGDGF
jgi:hypothetical protein